jgi:uncharacterized BrkB/YihY/UPF0761 family membrane protein
VTLVYAKRRRKPKIPIWSRVAGVHWLAPAAAITLCAAGFVRESAIAIYRQDHGPAGAEHPWDWHAEFFLIAILVILAFFALGRVAKPVRRRKARASLIGSGEHGKPAKRRARSG